MNHQPWLPLHRIDVTAENIDEVRDILPADQKPFIEIGCSIWRMPSDVDTWTDPCGVTLTIWPQDMRGALHHDGSVDGSEWGRWNGSELWLDDGFAVDVTGRILRVIGEQPASNETNTHHGDNHD